MPIEQIAGVDGCKNGWVIAIADTWPPRDIFRIEQVSSFIDVLERTRQLEVTTVDMPIGLPATGQRHCDLEAKKILGSRVFYAPPRATLAAKNPGAFQAAHRDIIGKGAGLPVWAIVPKLREVDAVITPGLQERVYEYHPEVTWSAMSGSNLASKHSAEGIIQRLSLIADEGLAGLSDAQMTGLSSDVKIDDVLDSIIGLATAQQIRDRGTKARRLPAGETEVDEHGLRMEIWY